MFLHLGERAAFAFIDFVETVAEEENPEDEQEDGQGDLQNLC